MLVVIFVMEMRMPTNAVGWSGMVGVAVLQAIGAPLYLFAIAKVGALKTGMATNIQPVTAIFEAWVLFDEVLGALQALGGALVLFVPGKIVFGVEFGALGQKFFAGCQLRCLLDGLRLAFGVAENVITPLVGAGLPGALQEPECSSSDR